MKSLSEMGAMFASLLEPSEILKRRLRKNRRERKREKKRQEYYKNGLSGPRAVAKRKLQIEEGRLTQSNGLVP